MSVSQGRRFRTVVPSDKPLTADVTTISQDASGAIWIGTFGMGLLRLKDLPDEGPVQMDRFEESKGPGERYDKHRAPQEWWGLVRLEAGLGLHLWSASKSQFTDYPESELAEQQRITSYFESSDGSFWVGTQEHGAVRFIFSKTKRSTSYDLPTGMPSSFVYAFGEDEMGHVWIGTWDAGLVRVDKDGLRLFNKSNGLHSQTIRALSRDREVLCRSPPTTKDWRSSKGIASERSRMTTGSWNGMCGP